MHRDSFYCAFNRTYVEGIKPDENSPLVVVLSKSLLPDSDRLVVEDVNGFRYRRLLIPDTYGAMVFERL